MVKRWEKKGRKPILQLEDSNKNPTSAASSSGASTSGFRGLIQYDDSDNENGVQDSDSMVTSAGETKKIDLEVADFLKEIDALTEGQDTSEAEAKEEEEEEDEEDSRKRQPPPSRDNSRASAAQNSGDPVGNSVTLPAKEEMREWLNSARWLNSNRVQSFLKFHNMKIIMCGCSCKFACKFAVDTLQFDEFFFSDDHFHGHSNAWQQCYDEGSGYTYYWNVETNQVTWECPEVLESGSKVPSSAGVNHNSEGAGPSGQEGNGCRHLPLKKQPHRTRNKLEVGKIIPITYFDQSTTSDSSDDETACSEPSQKKRKMSPVLSQHGPNLRHVPHVNSPDTAFQPANGVLSSDDVVTSPSHNTTTTTTNNNNNSEVFYGPQLPEILEMNPAERLNECDTAAPSSSDQSERKLTNGLSSPLDLSHSLERNNCDQSNVCESSDSVTESSHMDVALSVDHLVESGSSPLIQVRNISESVEPDADSVEVSEVEPSTSSLNYASASGDDSEEPDSTCTSRKTESNANQSLGREATSVPQGLKSILQYEESESEPEPEPVSASPMEQSVPLWSLYEAKSDSSIDNNHNFLVPQHSDEPKQSRTEPPASSAEIDIFYKTQSTSSTSEQLPMRSSHRPDVTSQQLPLASCTEEPMQLIAGGQAGFFHSSSTSAEQDVTRQNGSRKGSFFQPRGSNSVVTTQGLGTGNPEEDNRQSTSFSSSVRHNLQTKGFLPGDKRHGFGFNQLEPSEPEVKHSSSSVRPGISFVRSSEVFELNKLNEDPKPKDVSGSKIVTVVEPSVAGPDSDKTSVATPSSVRPESLEDEEMDLDDIEKELDKALERKQNSSSGTVRPLEMPSTSRQADLMERNLAMGLQSSSEPNTSGASARDSLEALSVDLLMKLKLLNAERSHLPLFTLLLIMFETRHTDWQRGALDSQYFAARLQESSSVLRQYEENASPAGWTCVWDRLLKKYIYVHETSGMQQTEFPTVAEDEPEGGQVGLASTSSSELPANVMVGHSRSSAGQNPMVTSSTAEELFRSVARSGSLGDPRRTNQAQSRGAPTSVGLVLHPPDPPVPELVAPPLPPTPPPPISPPPAPPKSPPPPPDSTELKEDDDLLVEMDMEDSNSKESSSDANPSSSSGSLGLPARPTIKTSIGGATLPSTACLEQAQVAFYESLGSSCMAETNFTNNGVVISSDAIISKPPQTLPCPVVATAISTSDIPQQQQQQQDKNYVTPTPTAWTQPSSEYQHTSEQDTLNMDTSVGSPRPSIVPSANASSAPLTQSAIPGTSSSTIVSTVRPLGVSSVEMASGSSGAGPSGSSGHGPSGFSGAGPSGSCGPGPSGFSGGGPSSFVGPGLSGFSVPGPSGFSVAGPSGFTVAGTSGFTVAGPSGFSGPGPSGSSGPGPSGSSVPGPSGSSGSGPSGSCGPGPSGLSVSGPMGAGPSGISDNITSVPGPSHSSGESSGLNSTSKKDKKKTKISSGLSMKKKNMSSLVQKWQKIKKEQLLEEGLAQNERRSLDRDEKKYTDQDGKISSTYVKS